MVFKKRFKDKRLTKAKQMLVRNKPELLQKQNNKILIVVVNLKENLDSEVNNYVIGFDMNP
jgi:hypothetical protein